MKKGILVAAGLALAVQTTAFAATEKAKKGVDELNELLRGEMSAVETYDQALNKVGNEPEAAQLKDFRNDHQKAVETLKSEVTKLGGTPSDDSGAWGTWAKTVEGTAKIFGDTAALKALKEGEEHGLKEHKEALNDADVSGDIKTHIREHFIPKQEAHIKALDAMIDKVS